MRTVRPIRAFSDNYIWLLEADDGRVVVVDPGDADPVADELSSRQLTLSAILVTHHHFDHTGGVAELATAWGCPVYGPANPAIAAITHPVAAGDQVEVLNYRFEVIAVPGHTLDHIAYFEAGEEPLLFCGDTLFAGGCGRVFEGTYPMMFESLQRLAMLPDETRVYCAHEYTRANLAFAKAVEPHNAELAERIARVDELRDDGQPTVPSLLATELATNPFMRCSQTSVMQGLAASGRPADGAPEDCFAELRQWKDNFR
ncbi:hydroxyacylglutathione hydrolase [Chromatocurvus halotolerans]|uniref:Hydroxyacylglutathione hydrolase n=1 Tax=Chromatocurvus halotolerans TaxID=1132028 RepID=A0A4R2KPF1_9GAMM|nr:hydroxyacylglutathione hydrolase [Chromatocurvus halotolerans]TCO72729.1 hydroxyacylglutathione hydrolase [Chromatocurvus halotolerans]